MRKKALLLINPVSGIGKQKGIEKLVKLYIDKDRLDVDLKYTEYAGHARELSLDAADRYDMVVAVGGDGTVNEVGTSLIGSRTAMAIIPTGSGNGLARHLKIPMRLDKAVQLLNRHKVKKIDTVKVNDFYSLNVAGVGFDAYISHLFAKMKQRGLISYVKLVTRQFGVYEPSDYVLDIDGKKISQKAFLISFANSSQYGNNFYIAPDAKVDDGFFDVCIMNEFPKIAAPVLLMSMMSKENIGGYLERIIKAKEVLIEHKGRIPGHIDGEPVWFNDNVLVKVNPASLHVVVPRKTGKGSPRRLLIP